MLDALRNAKHSELLHMSLPEHSENVEVAEETVLVFCNVGTPNSFVLQSPKLYFNSSSARRLSSADAGL